MELHQSLKSEMSRAAASVVLTPSSAEVSRADAADCEPLAHVPCINAHAVVDGAVKRAGQTASLRCSVGLGAGGQDEAQDEAQDESRQSHGIESMLHEFDALLGISSHHDSDRHEGTAAELPGVQHKEHKELQGSVHARPQQRGQSASIAGFASFRCTPFCGAPYPPADAQSAGGLDLSWSLDDELAAQEGL